MRFVFIGKQVEILVNCTVCKSYIYIYIHTGKHLIGKVMTQTPHRESYDSKKHRES